MPGNILDIIKYWGLFSFILIQPLFVFASDNYLAGARSLALSHASVSFSDSWAAFHNQAGIAWVSDLTTGFYFESRFGLDELSLAAGILIMPTGQGAFAVSLYQFGKGTFRENKYGLAYARQLSGRWSAGLQLDFFSQLFPENGNSQGFATFEGGVIFNQSEKLHLGIHVFNPVHGGFDSTFGKLEMPLVIRGGGHYAFDETVLGAFEVAKDDLNPAVIKTGIEFLPADNFALRIGVSGKPFIYTAGFGYKAGPLSADIGFGYHGNLGITPSLSVQIEL